MSADATGWVIRHSPYKGQTLMIHIMVADSVSDMHNNDFWMTQAKLAAKARCSPNTTSTALALLLDDGFLVELPGTPPARGGKLVRHFRFVFKADEPVVFEARWTPETNTQSPRIDQGPKAQPLGDQYAVTDICNTQSPRIEPKIDPKGSQTKHPAAPTGAECCVQRLLPELTADDFIAAYPKQRRVNLPDARRAWSKATKQADPCVIVAAARAYAEDPNLPETRYIPHPATWLNRESWLNGPCPPRNEVEPDYWGNDK